MTAQQLKNSILQMAVQGKLVPQDPNDEPASVLLERIRAEKEQLIKQKKIKREKNPSVIFKGADNTPYEKIGTEVRSITDEIPFEIPDSWEWVRWGTLSESIQYGYNAPALEKGRIKMVRISDIQDNAVLWETVPFCDIPEYDIDTYLLKPNDILFARTGGTVGKSYLVREVPVEAIYAGYLIRTRYSIQLCPQYLKYFMESELYWSQLREGTIATAQPNCNGKTLANMLVPIPPQKEQVRIVEKLDELMKIVNEYDAAYSHVTRLNAGFPDKLKKAILQKAVQGKLVAQDPNDEPASVLLARIQTEKERLIKAGKIKRDKHESVIFRRDNSHYEKRGSVIECIDSIIPFEIPDSWEWVRLETIITSTDAGKSPQCDNRPRKDDEWGVIKTTAIQDGNFVSEENKVLPHGFVVNDAIVVHDGDLLITRAGPRNRTGVVCVVEEKPTNLILSDKTVRLSYMRGFVNPLYIMTALNSPAVQFFVIEAMSGMAASQVNISQEKMKTFLLPFPPFDEQQRIVDAVRALYAQISRLTF